MDIKFIEDYLKRKYSNLDINIDKNLDIYINGEKIYFKTFDITSCFCEDPKQELLNLIDYKIKDYLKK